jgi:di/tripeptidase
MLLPCLILVAALAAPPPNTPSLPTILNGVIARDAQTQRDLKGMEYDEHVHTERLDAQGHVTQHQDLQLIVRPGAKPELKVVSVHGDHLPTDPDEAAREAAGKETQRRQQTFDLKEISTRFRLTLLGIDNDAGTSAYVIAFEPKPGQPYRSQTEKVLNQLHGRIWVRTSDDTILRTEATLAQPVQVAWIFASITKLDFHYELPPGGSEYGPAWLETFVEIHAPLLQVAQRQRVDMDGFRPR